MTIEELFGKDGNPVDAILAGVYGEFAKTRAQQGGNLIFIDDQDEYPFIVYPMNSEKGGLSNWMDGCAVVHGPASKYYGRRAPRGFDDRKKERSPKINLRGSD